MILSSFLRRHVAGAIVLAVAAVVATGSFAQDAAPGQPVPEAGAPQTSAPEATVPETGLPGTVAPQPDAAPSQPDAGSAAAPAPTTEPSSSTIAPPSPPAAPTGAGEAAPAEPVVSAQPEAAEAPSAEPAAEPLAAREAVDVETGDVAGAAMAHDLSPWGMFMAADWVVQAVMIGLVFASFVTWTIWLAKALELALAKRRARSQVARIERAGSLRRAIEEGRKPLRRGPVAALALTAASESELSGRLPADGVKERVAVALQRIEARSGRQMSRGTGILATIGSTAPFVGLFGTVWGIMNSFIGIVETNTTNLAVVAPGIAEALLATGIGLVAAIPAVIIYNAFSRSIAGYRAILADGSAAVMRHLSRDLDRRDASQGSPYAQPAE